MRYVTKRALKSSRYKNTTSPFRRRGHDTTAYIGKNAVTAAVSGVAETIADTAEVITEAAANVAATARSFWARVKAFFARLFLRPKAA